MAIHPRHKAFLDELPKNGNKVLPSALKAGYKESYARANGRNIVKSALKAKVEDIKESIDNKGESLNKVEVKRLMSEIIGLSQEDVMLALKNIALNEKDYGSALKVLSALGKEYGVVLQEEETKTIVPVLNIGVREIAPSNNPYNPLIVATTESVETIDETTEEEGMGGRV